MAAPEPSPRRPWNDFCRFFRGRSTSGHVCDDDKVIRERRPRGGQGRTQRFVWCGYAAFTVGVLYALVSVYWAAGGTLGLKTLGGQLERLGRARDPQLIAVVWVTAGLKLFAAVLGLALVRPWGRRLPRWMLLIAAWGTTVVLVLYGGTLVIVQSLVQIGVIAASADMDWTAFHWHLFLWDPWFLVWGLLLGAATWGFVSTRRTRDDGTSAAGRQRLGLR